MKHRRIHFFYRNGYGYIAICVCGWESHAYPAWIMSNANTELETHANQENQPHGCRR